MIQAIQLLESYEDCQGKKPKHNRADNLSTCDVARLLAYIEWWGNHGGGQCCPCCEAFPENGHTEDCLLHWVLKKSWSEHPGRLDQAWLAR